MVAWVFLCVFCFLMVEFHHLKCLFLCPHPPSSFYRFIPFSSFCGFMTVYKISPGCSLEGLMLKLKLQCFGHLMRRVDSLEKTLMLGGIGGRRRRGQQRMRWLDGITDSMTWVWVNSGSWWWAGRPGVLRFMGSQRVGLNWATELNKILTECGPLEKGMANHLSILALRTPWTVWKGKMIGYRKRNSPGR